MKGEDSIDRSPHIAVELRSDDDCGGLVGRRVQGVDLMWSDRTHGTLDGTRQGLVAAEMH